MSEKLEKPQQGGPRWAGLDWGEYSHSVSVVDESRAVVARFEVEVSLEGFSALSRQLGEADTIAGIAIESTASLVVPFLLSKGYKVYLINPKMSKHWRESISVAGAKSDARDGLVLALELTRRHESLCPLQPQEPAVAELAALCETVRSLVDERTALLQRLKAVLRQYYPAALQFFSDWSSPASWRFLKRFPQPQALAKARKNTLNRFLKSNHIGLSPRWQERVEKTSEATAWPRSQEENVLELRMLSIVAQLQAVQPHIDKCDRMIAERSKELPQASIIESLPAAGERLAPALTAIVALVESEPDRLEAMRCLSGVAPVEHSSGKRCATRIRKRCNKHWRNVLHLYANVSLQHCGWARAFYDLCRERGDGYATALRKLADKWLKIIHRMLANNENYDDERYVKALEKSGSPVYARLCGKSCG